MIDATDRCEFAAGAFLLRAGLGLQFLIAGLNKFLGEGGAAGASKGIIGMFSKSWLPAKMVEGFALPLPYFEVTLGALILIGLFRRFSVIAGGLLMLSLFFGMMVAASPIAAQNLVSVGLFSIYLFMHPWDRFALDTLFFRRARPTGAPLV